MNSGLSKTIKNEDKMLKLNSGDKLKSNDEFYKTSSKIINNLLVGYFNPEPNKIIDSDKDLIKIEKKTKPDVLKKQQLFANQKYYTKKELKTRINNIFQNKKRASIQNFNQNRLFLQNQNKTKPQYEEAFTIRDLKDDNIKKKKKYIEYEDFYFEDDMFIPESSSFPNENEEDFLLKLQFIEENDYNEDIEDHSIRYCSINYKKNQSDQIHSKYFNNSEKDKKEKKIPEFDNLYKEETEEIGKNILYTDNSKSQNNMVVITKRNTSKKIMINEINEQSISYINIDLLIKKVTLENFRNKFSFIYKCFIEQFKYFIPINNLVNKIFSAFNYYHETKKIDCTELLLFLNTLIYGNFDIIKEDKKTLNQLQDFYIKIKVIKWENQNIIQDLKSLDFLLFKSFPNIGNKIEINEIIDSIEISEPKPNKYLLESLKVKTLDYSKKKNVKGNVKKVRYFYVLNFKKEEIAQYLTCESYQLLSDIPECELYNKNFSKKDKDIIAPHIKKIFDRYEKLTYFIIEDICSYDHTSERVDVIEKWIRVAFVCLEYKNFNDLIMLNTLFCHYLLKKKLKKTWTKLSKKTLNYLEKMNKICSGQQCYKKIRNEIFKCKGPYVPYIGILLKELTYIEEKNYILDNNNVNIKKLTELNRTISKFFEFKRYKYSFDKQKNLEILSNPNPRTSEEIEGIIKNLEPKLLIHAKKGDKKRLTQTDEFFYN